jgi:hypothetical protein
MKIINWLLLLLCVNFAIYSQSEEPVIFNQNESGVPGKVIGFQGHAFGENPELWFTPIEKNGKLKPEKKLNILTHSNMNVSAILPEEPSLKGKLLAIWVKNGELISKPVFINKARIVSVEYTEISPGYIFRLFGRNMTLPGHTPEVVFLDISSGKPYPATVIHSEPYMLTVKAPVNLQSGSHYNIQISNGSGGKWGQSIADEMITVRKNAQDYFGIGVPWAGSFDFYENTYNVLNDTRLVIKAKGDGIHNDRDAIQQAIDLAHRDGGGVIYLPKGIYRLEFNSGSGLVMKSKVVLKGDGQEKTVVQYGFGTPPPYPDPIGKGGWPDETTEGVAILWPVGTNLTGLADFKLQNVNTSGLWRHSLKTMLPKERKIGSAGTGYFAVNCHFDLAVSWGLSWAFVDKMAIVGCYFDLKAKVTWPWPWHCDGVSNFVVRNNRVYYSAGRLGFNEGLNGIIENNHITRYGDLQTERGETGGFNIDYAKDIIIMGNKMDVVGKFIEQKNQGETILSQGCNPFGQSLGEVTSATSTSITDIKQNWPPLHTASADYKGGVNVLLPTTCNAVAIISGRGCGQWRYIVKNSETTVYVNKPWDVIPDSTSRFTVIKWSAEDWLIKDNILNDNHQGIMLYCGGMDVAIVGNILTNSGGIYLRSDQRVLFGRYNITWNVSVADNQVVNNNGLRSAHVAMWHVKVKNDNSEILGTGTIGIEMRRNLVQASVPNVNKAGGSSGLNAEGFLNCVTCANADNSPCDLSKVAIVGTIMEDNIAINTDYAYQIGRGAYNTVIIPGEMKNVSDFLKEIEGGAQNSYIRKK